jgi:predicted nucleic-acid-binding Zn-ribbon protein/Zn-finger protein
MPLFKAFIRVVKSLSRIDEIGGFSSQNVISERVIDAADKHEVKRILLERYPQFFQNGKVYEKETKDQAQFFYVVIYPLFNYEVNQILDGEWVCDQCNQVHENQYVDKPHSMERLFPGKLFCKSDNNICFENFKRAFYEGIELPDDEIYVKADSPIYIYKITEKSSGKSYVGKTRNAPFFRWWNHLTHSSSPFGLRLRNTELTDWTFEVLRMLPPETNSSDVFDIESKYIIEYDCLKNGYNSLISKKQQEVKIENQIDMFS